ncbi:MAG: hypothetical protein MRY63_11130 [Neomegalonema sp.]|nr:hypothetical protein [Neomegalonema sp.]
MTKSKQWLGAAAGFTAVIGATMPALAHEVGVEHAHIDTPLGDLSVVTGLSALIGVAVLIGLALMMRRKPQAQEARVRREKND